MSDSTPVAAARRSAKPRWRAAGLWVLCAALVGGAGFWAGRSAVQRPEPVPATSGPTVYTVAEGTVEQVQTHSVQARWSSRPVAYQVGEGIVTSIDVEPGTVVDVGHRLFAVNQRPVLVAQGDVPAFRSMSLGDTGADVEQLERFLAAVGKSPGMVDGTFSSATDAAVRSWQRTWNVPDDGVVAETDVIFLPDLPARIRLGADASDPNTAGGGAAAESTDGLTVGRPLAAGSVAVSVIDEQPSFTMTLGADQADLVPLVAEVAVRTPDLTWSGRVTSSEYNDIGELIVTLQAAQGGPICADSCDQVPVGPTSVYQADLIVTPRTTGPAVPLAALVSHPGGSVTVVDADGQQVAVTVLATGSGQAIVDGLDVGTEILIGSSEVTPR